MSEIKHTLPPWNYFVGNANGRGLIRIEQDGTGKHIASMPRGAESEANAGTLVEAVNSHASLTAERDRLREALEFYADELTWADTNPKNDGRLTVLVPSPSFAEIDRGERARAALNPAGAP